MQHIDHIWVNREKGQERKHEDKTPDNARRNGGRDGGAQDMRLPRSI